MLSAVIGSGAELATGLNAIRDLQLRFRHFILRMPSLVAAITNLADFFQNAIHGQKTEQLLRGAINQVIRGRFGQSPWNNSPGISFPPFRQPWIISPHYKLLINDYWQFLCQLKINMEP
jgi:hypothetical protein